MKKTAFLESLKRSRHQFTAALNDISARTASRTSGPKDWSVKDLIAHITWYEREMIELLETRALAGSSWWTLETTERNARIFEENRSRGWEEVKGEAEAVHARLWEALLSLEEEALVDARYFRDMPPDWVPWKIIAENSFLHYEDHLVDLMSVHA